MTIKGLSGPEIERLKKNIVKTFKDYGLNVTTEANFYTVNYLDVTFDLQKSECTNSDDVSFHRLVGVSF